MAQPCITYSVSLLKRIWYILKKPFIRPPPSLRSKIQWIAFSENGFPQILDLQKKKKAIHLNIIKNPCIYNCSFGSKLYANSENMHTNWTLYQVEQQITMINNSRRNIKVFHLKFISDYNYWFAIWYKL